MTIEMMEQSGRDFTVFCLFCDKLVTATLLNDFLEHLASSHNLKIYRVLLGQRTVIQTNLGDVEVRKQDTMARA